MPENPQIISFLLGVALTLVGALVANLLIRDREKKNLLEERRFAIYMKLLELHTSYFWFTVAELHKEAVLAEVKQKCLSLSWQTADLLRSADEMDFLEDILDITLGSGFPTAVARHKAMGKLLDKMGKRVNPKYAKKIQEISMANVANLASGRSSNAPGAG